jgi:ABC-type nickel/cobalt efflux system permease component RcnA
MQPRWSWRRRLALVGLLAAALLAGGAAAAAAHPLGNFTVNQYSGLRLEPRRVEVDYVVDMAEIPTFQTRQEIDADGDGTVSGLEAAAWQSATCRRLAGGLELRLGGRVVPLSVGPSRLRFPPGQGGLSTLRLECALTAATGPLGSPSVVTFRNGNYADRVGWREITAVGDGTTVTGSSVPAVSASARLTSYPRDLLRSPLDQRAARVSLRPGGARLAAPGSAPDVGRAGPAALPLGVDRATKAFTGLVARERLGLAFGAAALLLALLLGALHAVAPGHGKTVMAAYLLGQRGGLRQALLVGLTVTATHTAGVLALGVVLSASSSLAPERLYPWLGLASGLLLISIGVSLLRGALRRHGQHHRGPGARRQRDGDHGQAHAHHHAHGHGHGRDHPDEPPHGRAPARDHARRRPERPVGWRGLLSMGFAGGLVPSPSALVVLLGAIALHRAWFGVLLVVAYGAGMAVTLTGAGLLLVRARAALDRRAAAGPAGAGLGRWRLVALTQALPPLTAAVIVVVGVFLAVRGATAIGAL